MRIYFVYRGEVKTLPINPEELKIERQGNNETAEVVGLGEVTVVKGAKLRELAIESFFPSDSKPKEFIDFFSEIMDDKKPLRIVCKDFALNMQVSINGFEHSVKAGEEKDRYYNLELKEWKNYSPRKVKVKKKSKKKKKTKAKRTEQPKKKSGTYTVKRGDSLWKIAKKYTGSGSKWGEIYSLNKAKIGNNPNVIKVGQKLTIPKRWK